MAPITLRLMQGISTSPATGSHTRPSRLVSAIASASAHCSAVPPCRSTSAAAAMPLAAPTSAWHPPSAPARVARAAMIWPNPAETYSARQTASSPARPARHSGSRTAGKMPQLPAVGAATMRFMQALHSAVFSASAMTWARYPSVSSLPPTAAASTLAASPPANPLLERSVPQ